MTFYYVGMEFTGDESKPEIWVDAVESDSLLEAYETIRDPYADQVVLDLESAESVVVELLRLLPKHVALRALLRYLRGAE